MAEPLAYKFVPPSPVTVICRQQKYSMCVPWPELHINDFSCKINRNPVTSNLHA